MFQKRFLVFSMQLSNWWTLSEAKMLVQKLSNIVHVLQVLFKLLDHTKRIWFQNIFISSRSNYFMICLLTPDLTNGLISAFYRWFHLTWFPPKKLIQIPGLPRTFFTFSRTFCIKVLGIFQDFLQNSRTFQDFYGVVRIATITLPSCTIKHTSCGIYRQHLLLK